MEENMSDPDVHNAFISSHVVGMNSEIQSFSMSHRETNLQTCKVITQKASSLSSSSSSQIASLLQWLTF